MKKLILLLLFSVSAYANPPVIWYGNDAKFLNPGSIIVPGLAPGGVCSVDTNGKFTVGTIAASSVTGTANRFAGFNSSGNLEAISNYVRNSYGGQSVNQAPTLSNTGSSQIINNHSLTLNTSTDITDDVYGELKQIELGGTNNYQSYTNEMLMQQTGANDITGDVVMFRPRIQYGVGGGTNSSQNTRVLDSTIRLSGNHTANNIIATASSINMDSGSTSNYTASIWASNYVGGTVTTDAYGIDNNLQVDGSAQNAYGIYNKMYASGTLQSLYGINSYFNGNLVADYTGLAQSISGDVGGNSNDVNINHTGDIVGGSTNINIYHEGLISNNHNGFNFTRNGNTTGGLNIFSGYVNSSSNVGGDFRIMNIGNDGTISNNGAGSLFYQNGTVTKSYTGYGTSINADVGDGTGNSAVGFQAQFQNHAINGGAYGLQFNNNSSIANTLFGVDINNSGALSGGMTGLNIYNNGTQSGNYSVVGVNFANQSDGYSVSGFNVFNDHDLTEQFAGVQINNDGDTRTATGVQVTLQGNCTDDCQGVRVSVENQTSSTQHVASGQFNGGQFSVQGSFKPFSSATVEVANSLSTTVTIDSGSPLTGTDQILTLLQPNLLVNDNIATGPIGLDTNMIAAVSQLAVASGKNVPVLRSMLLGTSTPSGSGGTIGDVVTLEVLGLPSFGGSVTLTGSKYGIKDSQLLGQDFCGGVTNCWFLNVRDDAAENYLEKLAINTASETVASGYRLDVNGMAQITGVQLNTSVTQPTCDSSKRGLMWNVEGGTGVADDFQICQKDASDNYVWVSH